MKQRHQIQHMKSIKTYIKYKGVVIVDFKKYIPFVDSDDKKKKNADVPEIYQSLWGDRDPRTRQGITFFFLLFFNVLGLVLCTVWLVVQLFNYGHYLKENTTKIGTELQFAKSKAKVTLNDVWTDKDRNVTMVKLGYDNQSRNLLSTKGKNYKIYLIDKEGKKPKGVKISYGILGSEGDGYLFIKGHLKEKAYQILLTSQIELTTGNETEDDSEDDDSATDIESQKSEDISDASIKRSLSKSSQGDISDNGILNFDSKKNQPNADYINFRVNAFSDSTHVFKGSFLKADNTIDYGKVIEQTSLRTVIKDIDDKIKEREKKAKQYQVSLEEYEQRAKDNKEDTDARSSVNEIKDSIKENNEKLDNLKASKEKYENADFDKSSFGDMQENYTATPLH